MKRIRSRWRRCKLVTSMICRKRTWAGLICTPTVRKYWRKFENIMFIACEFGINKGMRALGPILAVLAVVLISLVTYEYFTQVFPILIYKFDSYFQTYLVTLVGVWCLINIVFNHQSCVWTNPGFAPTSIAKYPADCQDIPQKHYRHDPELKSHQSYRYCETCNTHKPWRSHHCSICKICVLRMDHHCPWMWNCVGFRNYRYFFMFLFYLWLGTLFYVTVGYYRITELYKIKSCYWDGLPFFLCRLTKNRSPPHRIMSNFDNNIENNVENEVVNNNNSNTFGWKWGLSGLLLDSLFSEPSDSSTSNELFIFSYFLSIGIFVVMTGFLGWHLYLVFTNQTTLESISNVSYSMRKLRRFEQLHDIKFLFDLGSYKLNFIQLFGEKWWKSFLPVWTKPIGNGFVYPLRNEIKSIVYIDTANALNI